MKRAQKSKPDIRRKMMISEKQLTKVKAEVTEEAVTKCGMLYLAALAERGWSEDDIVELFQTISRYSQYIDDHILRLREVQDVIERRTGMKIKGGW